MTEDNEIEEPDEPYNPCDYCGYDHIVDKEKAERVHMELEDYWRSLYD